MEIKNNYHECLTNLACSIRKYFNLEYKHNTLSYIDKILNEFQPENVVTILCDGMGYNILKRTLNENDFLIKHLYKSITSVFPATTVAATTSMITGLNPAETGMIGWHIYLKDLDRVVVTYRGHYKEDPNKVKVQEIVDYINKHMITKSIESEINEKGEFKGYTVSPFCATPYQTVDEMYETILKRCNEPGKKYIYAYNVEPDTTMHMYGSDSEEAKLLIKDANNRIEDLASKVHNTIIFVVADHGHMNIDNINLEDYPDLVDCFLKNTSIESRTVNFFIKEDKKEEFVMLFNKYFGNDFDLITKEDVLNLELFGDGKENSIFRSCLGDYLAIAKTNKALLYIGNDPHVSNHAGYTDDEVYVPLVLVKKR